MARKVSDQAPSSRPLARRRRRLPTARRGLAPTPLRAAAVPPPAVSAETVAEPASRPSLAWVLVTDATGRTRPEALWS